jgi:hypothetical protein
MGKALHAAARSSPSVVDYDIHGLVGIRLIDPSPRDVLGVSAQIGPDRALTREPDFTIRFIDEVRPSGPVKWIEPHEIGFTDEGFFLFTANSRAGPVARLSLDASTRGWEMQCRSGLRAVPLLLPLVDLIMWTKGVFAVHASAFTYKGTGVLVAGWARSGKTTSLLAFMARGASYIGDDRVYLRVGENDLYGLAQPIALRAWHLRELPRYARIVGWRGRSRLRMFAALDLVASKAAAADRVDGVRDLARRVAAVAADASVSVPPHRLFGECSLEGRLDKAFLAIAYDRPDVRVEPLDPGRFAQRLMFSLRAERLRIWSFCLAFRFAFPDQLGSFIEAAGNTEEETLASALELSETYALYHPFPVPVEAVHDAIAPIVG